MLVTLENFGGLIPKLSDRLLPGSAATIAENTKMYSGELRAWRTVKPVTNLGLNATSAYRLLYNDGNEDSEIWMSWNADTDIVRAPVVNDAWDRYYWTIDFDNASGASKPATDIAQYNTAERIYNGSLPYDLGIPTATDSVGVVPTSTGEFDETRAYAYTFISAFGEEGPPWISDVVPGFETDGSFENPGTYWELTGFPSEPAGNHTVASIRIYRTVSGYENTVFFYVGDADLDDLSFKDYSSNLEISLNNQLESLDWEPPPTGLRGLIAHPNGFLVGFVGKDVYMSFPYRPHAWPTEYILAVDYDVVGLGLVGNSIIVMTEAFTYAMTGIRPEAVTLVKTNSSNPCISKRSIVNFHNAVLYQSSDGIMITDGNTVNNQTLQVMTVTDWQELYGQYGQYTAARYGDRYIAFNNDSDGFLLDFIDNKQALINLTELREVNEIFLEELSGDTMLIEGARVLQWDPHDTIVRNYAWQSKEMTSPKPINFGAIQVKFYTPSDLTGTDDSFLNEVWENNRALMGMNEVCSDNGTSGDDYKFRIQRVVESLVEMMLIEFVAPTTSTGAATLTLGDAPEYPLVQADGSAIGAGTITATNTYKAYWDTVSWVLYSEDDVLYSTSKWNQYHLKPMNGFPINGHGGNRIQVLDDGDEHWVGHEFAPHRGPVAGSGVVPTAPIAQVIPNLQVTVWARNTYSVRTHIVTLTIEDQNVYRLPSGFKSDVWQVEVRGNLHVYSVSLAENPYELRAV